MLSSSVSSVLLSILAIFGTIFLVVFGTAVAVFLIYLIVVAIKEDIKNL